MEFSENIKVYNLDKNSKYLLDLAYNNLDTEKGYRAYYALKKYIIDNGKDNSILFDLAAEFNWDDKLSIEVSKCAREEHRFDLIVEDAMRLIEYAVRLTDSKGHTWFRLKGSNKLFIEADLYIGVYNSMLYPEGDIEFECKYLNSANEFIRTIDLRAIKFTVEPFPVYVTTSD